MEEAIHKRCETLYRIELSYACYGIIIKHAIVVHSPPIAKWMVGKNISFIKEWVKKKKGKIKEVRNLNEKNL